MFKQMFILCLISGIMLHSKAQKTTDTIKVIVNGQVAVIENNGIGKKTTLTFEDSLNVFQVSVIKFSKNNKPSEKENLSPKSPEKYKSKKSTRWLGEGSIGIVTFPFTKYASTFEFQYYNGSPYIDRATVIELKNAKLNPGIRLELFIKEKRREWGKKNFYFITGSRLQYNFTSGNATGADNTYELDADKKIRYDSLMSSYPTTMKSKFVNIKFCVPFILEKQLGSDNRIFSIQAGFLLGLNSNFSTIKQTSTDPFGTSSSARNVGYDGSPFITIQPTLRLLVNNKLSFNLTYDLDKSNFGFGATRALTSHPLCFGLGLRLY